MSTEDYARNVHNIAAFLRSTFRNVGDRFAPVEGIEEMHMTPPGGTTDYDGRSLFFTIKENGRTYLIMVEDVTTIDDEPLALAHPRIDNR